MAHRLTFKDVETSLVAVNDKLAGQGLRLAADHDGQGITLSLQAVRQVLASGLTKRAAMIYIKAYAAGQEQKKGEEK